ncbi:MAG: glucosaminidase domain-containing protein [Candidatus Levybacteria bacterium]|nr:glucosaminidase domain-containing protein [Candidatus Levybacteria bacterium]
MKKIIVTITVAILLLLAAPTSYAKDEIAASSAALISHVEGDTEDNRVTHLTEYLKTKNSPLVDSAATFVQEADKYQLDWKFVAAISGLESSFGKHIPAYSYNGWGWGVYGDNVMRFSSWDEAISTISQGLRENYINKGATDIDSIGKRYAASPTWAQRVSYFMREIERFEKKITTNTLSLSI